MSSPIHRALFSPPPSPPSRSKDMVDLNTKPGFTSIKTLLLPADLVTRNKPALAQESSAYTPAYSGNELKVRSPRTPGRGEKQSLETPRISLSSVEDVEATPRAPAGEPNATLTPRRGARSSSKTSSPPLNISSSPVSSALPRPFIRLLFFATLLFSSALILVFIPGTRLPSFHASALTRRFSIDFASRTPSIADLSSWQESMDRDYSPPQIRAPHMLKRAFGGSELARTVPPPLKAIRPSMIPRPLPESHEILAIQSYLLDSSYNVLSNDINPDSPVDANKVSSHKQLGKPGSEAEKEYLNELEEEHGQGVVVWYGGDGSGQLPHDVLDILHGLHGPARHPTLLPCHGRADNKLLHGIFDRLEIPFKHHPLVMIGNVPIVGDADTLEDLRATGALRTLLQKIGWLAADPTVMPQEEIDRVEDQIAPPPYEVDEMANSPQNGLTHGAAPFFGDVYEGDTEL